MFGVGCCRSVANRRRSPVCRGFLGAWTTRRGGHNPAGAVDNRKIDFRILGSLEVWVGDRLVGLGGEKPRTLLAIQLLHHDEVVSANRLIDDPWRESPPESALRTLQSYVSRLRKALAPNGPSPGEESGSGPAANGGVLLTRGRGYLLEVAPGELDLERFRDLAEPGRDALAAGSPGEAAAVLVRRWGFGGVRHSRSSPTSHLPEE